MAIRIRHLLRPSLLRPFHLNQASVPKPPLLSSPNLNPSSHSLPYSKPSPFSPQNPSFLPSRAFSSSPSNIVLVGSAQGLNSAVSKVQDEKSPAIFYFTAAWCGPCKLLSPVIEEMGKSFPHVTTYKVDIDTEGLGSILTDLKIFSVPTLHFFQDGKKAAEMVGADAAKLKATMENLYKKE